MTDPQPLGQSSLGQSSPGRGSGVRVWYVELRGEDTEKSLWALAGELAGQPGWLGAEVQLSPAQPGLALLVTRWQGTPPEWPLPPGAKAWAFEVRSAPERPGS